MPRYDLQRVQEAASQGRIRTGGRTYREKLLPYLSSLTALGLVTWYVKFSVERQPDGEVVVMASLHEPTETLRRVGGDLDVRFGRIET